MYFRNFSLALISTLVASGAWYAYKDSSVSTTTTSTQQTRGVRTSSLYSNAPDNAAPNTVSPEEAAQATRKAIVVDDYQFYTGEIVGDGPLQKDTDDAGRKVLEMFTPEQATQKLRRNEQSFLVARSRGVVRYDVVQIPSNDPIEDDHAEKIINVPDTVAATGDGSSSSDWMFWGVFDGHR
jgi:pyruvate dehydrogenase phosphatase